MLQHPFFNRQALLLRPDPARVVVRPFRPAIEPRDYNPIDKVRANHIVDRLLTLDTADVAELLATTLEKFDDRHRDLPGIFARRAGEMEQALASHAIFSADQNQLVGAFFLHEYSFEAAALFNPSIVPHPDQTDLAPGEVRFVLSLRAVGEGHVSSLTFRCGVIAADGTVSLDPPAQLSALPVVTARIGDQVDVAFTPDSALAERVIFPITEAQSNGIEDARFVAFEDAGRTTYYATYTAYNGRAIRSELIETRDFVSFRMVPLKGAASHNKGMALFPRKIDGRYAMIARYDNETLQLVYSDDLLEWNLGVELIGPRYAWEFVQIGNCGSPIELDQGWLLFTHGVGPVRHYAIGAVLLDKADPSKVIGRSRVPLVQPEETEREGYVPNVVYTCGAMRFGDLIILPYAISDTFSTFSTLRIDGLVEWLTEGYTA